MLTQRQSPFRKSSSVIYVIYRVDNIVGQDYPITDSFLLAFMFYDMHRYEFEKMLR